MDGPTYTQGWEGCTLTAIKDSRGYEIGWGHNSPDVAPGLIWTQDQADALFRTDYQIATTSATLDIGVNYWQGLDLVRRAALVDMAYEMGGTGLRGFHNMIAAVRAGDWPTAASCCMARNPRPAGGVYARALCNAEMLKTGQWQKGHGA